MVSAIAISPSAVYGLAILSRPPDDVHEGSQSGFPPFPAGRGTVPFMPDRSRNRPRDLNQLAARLVDEATSDAPRDPEPVEPEKDQAAVELGRRGGLKGGKARAERMTPEERSEAARRAVRARWNRDAS